MEKNQVSVTCCWCGKEFTRSPALIKKRVFCNRECYLAWCASRWDIYRCAWCRKEFRRNKGSVVYNKIFCSTACHNRWRSEYQRGANHHQYNRVQTACDQCGEPVWVTPAKLRENENHFCSNKCRYAWNRTAMTGENNPAWRGGYKDYYGRNWERRRREARQRDDYTCQRCGVEETELDYRLHVHHITPFREFENYEEANMLDNLITLCSPCHKIVEHGKKGG